MTNLTVNNQIINAAKIVQTLIKLNVDSIFGYPGAAVLSLYNELSKEKNIKHYLVRHEQAAVHAAEGYARVSGKTGVVLVTSGPGFTNTITGIANAFADSTPLVILAGDVYSDNKNGKIFQNVDIKSLVSSCSKKCYVLSSDDNVEDILISAFKLANEGVKGPVVIALPRNILESKSTVSQSYVNIDLPQKHNLNIYFANVINHINTAKKPLVIVGGGCIDATGNLLKFVEKLQCPTVSTLMGIGNFPTSNKYYLGMIGLNGNHVANIALQNADLIIALGVSFSNRSICNDNQKFISQKIINVNINESCLTNTLFIKSDVNDFLSLFSDYDFPQNKYSKWIDKLSVIKQEGDVEISQTDKLNSAFVLKTISDFTKNLNPIVVTDVGQHQMLTAQNFVFNEPRKFITSGGLGTMGFGLPAAIGAYIANSNNLILNITGDGSFQMNLQELATCREHRIPLKIIILNNGYLGMVRQMQDKIYQNTYQVEMINPDFKKIAEAYDLCAIRVERKEQLLPALQNCIEYCGTVLLDIAINQFESV